MKEENIVYDNNEKPRKNILLILSIMIVGIALVLAGTGVFLLSKPRAVFQESYNYLTKGFKDLELSDIKKLDALDKDKVKLESKMNVNLNLGVVSTSLDLDMQVMNDRTANTSKIFLDSKLNNQKLLELVSYLKDNKAYLTISDIFDKYYYTDVEGSIDDILTAKDIELLIDIFKDSLKKVITDDKFEVEETKTSIDGIEESVTKLTLRVDDKLASDLAVEVLSGIRNSDEALEVIANISSSSKEQLIKSLDEILGLERGEFTGETLFTYNIYYKNVNDIKKLEILSGTTVITYSANNDNYRVKVVDGNVQELSLVVSKHNDVYDISMSMVGFRVTGKLLKNEKNYNLTLDMSDVRNNKLGTIVVDYQYTSNVQDKLAISYQKDSVDYLKVTMDSKITFGENITVPEMSNAKSMDSITEEEINTIMTNLQNHQILGSLFSSYIPSDDDVLINDSGDDIYLNNQVFDIYQ